MLGWNREAMGLKHLAAFMIVAGPRFESGRKLEMKMEDALGERSDDLRASETIGEQSITG